MKMRSLVMTSALGVAASFLAAASAQATMVAGWDFSQYLGDGALTIDGASGANTLLANYSNLDPTGNAGAESAAFGEMYMNGSSGSSNVDPFAATPAFVPTAGSLSSNINAPVVGGGLNPFDSLTILTDEGQMFANLLSMTAQDVVSVVFKADLGSVPDIGSDWSISFGAKTFSGSSAIGIEFSTDGSSYSSFGSVNLTAVDTPFNVALGAAASDLAFVRLSFDPAGGQPIIDNVAINATLVPEPGTAMMLGLGLLGLAGLGRRRS